MFDFLFKKRRSAATASSTPGAQAPLQATNAASAVRAQAKQEAREQAMQQAAALQDEAAALAFIVQCEFAEARLLAAQWLQSGAALNDALQAVRNSDRRVAKLLQTRLDDLQRGQRAREQMQVVLEQTGALLRDPALTPDRAADADRAWLAACGSNGSSDSTAIDAALSAQFDAMRDALSERLAQQTQLQRSLIDIRMNLQTILQRLQQPSDATVIEADRDAVAEPDIDAGNVGNADISTMLERLQKKFAEDRVAPEAAALPKQLLPECERLLNECVAAQACRMEEAAAIALRQQTDRERQARQAEKVQEAAEAPELHVAQDTQDADSPAATATSPAGMPAPTAPPASDAPQPKASKAPPRPKPVATPEQLLQWQTLLGQLESALEEGALQAASEAERGLRAFDAKLIKPAAAETSRLNAAYASLHHLQGWARWGGNISREELLQAALALSSPAQALPIPELVQKIGGLRARWKLLNVSAGPSPHALWEQFDAACTAAYAPAAAQFEQQDKEREQNRQLAQALIEEAEKFAEQFAQQQGVDESAAEGATDDAAAGAQSARSAISPPPDWKQLAQFDARMRQAWQRLGPLGHKEHRVLERAFNNALKTVQKPLRQRQKLEVEARHALIAEATALAPDDRQALDTLRRIQADWQQRAQNVPLARKDEQALWLAFRAACDAIFAQRKQNASEQDAQREKHLRDKEAICLQLEQFTDALPNDTVHVDAALDTAFDPAAAQAALQQGRAAWSKTGPAPRTAERAIEQRFRKAADGLQRRLQIVQERAAAAAIEAEAAHIDTRLAMCFALDAALAQGRATVADADGWRARWQEAPVLPLPGIAALEQALNRRFDAALAALADGAESHAAQLERQRDSFDDALLEAEVALGLESPPQFSRQRMQLQVALLQASLKAGAVTLSGRQHLQRLCELPAVADQATLARIGDVVRRALAS